MSKWKGLLLLAVSLGAALVGGAIWAFWNEPLTSLATPPPVRNSIIIIEKGTSPVGIARKLQESGIIPNTRLFLWLGRLTRSWPSIKAGEYEVSTAMSPRQIFAVFSSGVSVAYPLTIREGANLYEVAAQVESMGLGTAVDFIAACKSPEFIASLDLLPADEPPPSSHPLGPHPMTVEGFLFPNTYQFPHKTPIRDMIRKMVRQFKAVWTADFDAQAKSIGLSRYQVVTLASMIEKETGAPQERPLISSVFHNRLRKKMKLQSDPTTIYGIWERYRGNLTRADLSETTPYNTYSIDALPIGPIANPGADALRAALQPAPSEFLFFVSRNDGTHEFTRTFEDHQKAVTKFQLDPQARKGKSWRDLKKMGSESPRLQVQ